jgi:uncharacterized protein
MKNKILYSFFLLLSTYCFAQTVQGTWQGNIKIPNASLKVVFHLTSDNNTWQATMDSPNQGAFGIPVQSVVVKNDSIFIKDARMLMQYTGVLKGDEISGKFIQGSFSTELNLEKETSSISGPNRPQTPKAPYPYKSEEIVIENVAEKVSLSGTLTLPNNVKSPTLVILISGSGPQDRDETIFNHKPFAVIADYLTKNGYAVFRFDDRGTAKSTGNFLEATSFNFASDVDAIVNNMATRRDINANKIGLLGHSEGGLIAGIVAANNPKVKFIISMAGPGVKGQDILLEQTYLIGKGANLTSQQLEQNKQINTALYQIILNENWDDFNESAIKVITKYKELDTSAASVNSDDLIQKIVPKNIKWFKTFLETNPSFYYSKLKIPVLAINGENDIQVSFSQNLPALQATFKNKKSKTISYPHLNHLFQTSRTQTIAEYNEIEETIAPIVLADIITWLNFNKL